MIWCLIVYINTHIYSKNIATQVLLKSFNSHRRLIITRTIQSKFENELENI